MSFYFEQRKLIFHIHHGIGLEPYPHFHPHVELVFFLNGSTKCVCDKKSVIAKAGDVFIAFPNQVHYYIDQQPPERFLLIFSPSYCPELSRELNSLCPCEPLISDAGRFREVEEFLSLLYEHRNDKTQYNNAYIKGLLDSLIALLLEQMELRSVDFYDSSTVKDIISFCYENYEREVSLKSISQHLHISPYHISHLFNEHFHISLSEYVNSLRLTDAERFLKSSNLSVTEISMRSGFNSIRTFNRYFKQIHGVTPSQYRNKNYTGVEALSEQAGQ